MCAKSGPPTDVAVSVWRQEATAIGVDLQICHAILSRNLRYFAYVVCFFACVSLTRDRELIEADCSQGWSRADSVTGVHMLHAWEAR